MVMSRPSPVRQLHAPTFQVLELGVVLPRSFDPETRPAGPSITKSAWKSTMGPRNWPGRNSSVCGPIVTFPDSVKVPGYGPAAVPETVNSNVEVPDGLQVPPV